MSTHPGLPERLSEETRSPASSAAEQTAEPTKPLPPSTSTEGARFSGSAASLLSRRALSVAARRGWAVRTAPARREPQRAAVAPAADMPVMVVERASIWSIEVVLCCVRLLLVLKVVFSLVRC